MAKRLTLEPAGRPRALQRSQDSWFQIQNKADSDTAVVSIYDEISVWGGVTAIDFARELRGVKAKNIELRLNSPGGDVFDGVAIYNALVDHPATVTTYVDGLAASIASVIAMAGDRVVMNRGSMFMIHDAHALSVGNAQDMRATADLLDKASDNIAELYASRGGKSTEEWRALMRQETWFKADEAVEAGLADEQVGSAQDGERMAAKFDLSIFNRQGPAAPEPEVEPEPEFDIAAIQGALKEAFLS